MKYFRELNLNILKDKTVILDIDGTICYDKHHEVEEKEKVKLAELKKTAKEVYLVSNGERSRTKSFAEIHEILSHLSEFQKPHRRVLENLKAEDMVVVGDKFLTDGLLALQAGIPFLHVKSLTRTNEKFIDKCIFFLDDVLGKSFELFRLIRPKQWIKNFLVFAPAFFAGSILNIPILLNSLVAFLVFSLSASLIYVLNDLNDKESDRMHFKKKWRPIASFNVSAKEAAIFAIILFVIIFGLLTFIPSILEVILLYVVSNILYTVKLKNVPVFDAVSVASMYVMRVVVGGLATGISVSPWIITCTFFASLFVITCKRYVEFQNPVRSVLKRYTEDTLKAMLIISAALSVFGYVLYTILGSHIEHVLYTSVFVITVFLIMLNDIFSGNKKLESPEIYLLTNRHIRFAILGWVICMFLLIYKFI